jgi:uncharacterized protein
MTVAADGIPRQLDPRVIEFDRLVGWIVTLVLAGISLVGLFIAWLAGSLNDWAGPVSGPAWSLLVAGLAWHAYRWPELSYARTSYVLDDQGIEIRMGVLWRRIISVPRSRVQHIDVTQGPMQRSYGLATLVIFTAGTAHSSVPLAGLAHETALALRDLLLPRVDEDGV